MDNDSLKIKHLVSKCPYHICETKAFVQVVVVTDQAQQKQIDRLANQKLRKFLNKAHKEGEHDGR